MVVQALWVWVQQPVPPELLVSHLLSPSQAQLQSAQIDSDQACHSAVLRAVPKGLSWWMTRQARCPAHVQSVRQHAVLLCTWSHQCQSNGCNAKPQRFHVAGGDEKELNAAAGMSTHVSNCHHVRGAAKTTCITIMHHACLITSQMSCMTEAVSHMYVLAACLSTLLSSKHPAHLSLAPPA